MAGRGRGERVVRVCEGRTRERVERTGLALKQCTPPGQVHVVHDVPLRVIQDASEMTPYAEPTFDSADHISVILPTAEIRGMKNVVEVERARSGFAGFGTPGMQ